MPTFTLEESNVPPPIPEDEVLGAELVDCKTIEKDFLDDNGNKVKRVWFKFVIQEPGSPWDGENITGDTPTTFNTHPDCTLKNWASAIANTEFPIGYRLETDVLLGMKCRIVTAQRKYQKEGKERIYCYVAGILPTRMAPVGASSF